MSGGKLEFVEGDGLPDIKIDFGRPLTEFLTKSLRIRTSTGRYIDKTLVDDDVALGLAHAEYADNELPQGEHLLNIVTTELDGRTRTYPSSGSISVVVRKEFSEPIGGRRDSTIVIREDGVTLTVNTVLVDQRDGAGVLVGVPTDGTYSDGYATISPADTIADAVDILNESLSLLNTASAPATTTTDLTIPVDYASTVDPPAGAVFSSQADVDSALGAATGFKHLSRVLESLPEQRHNITVNLADGVHRPESGKTIAWEINHRIRSGTLTIAGGSPSTWPTIVSSTAISAFQAGGNDPYIDCAAASFPNDGSLEGRHARLSTGQLVTIHEHTDARLRVLEAITGTPTSVEVVKPGAELRNSLNDTSAAATTAVMTIRHGMRVNYSFMSNLLLNCFGANTNQIQIDENSYHILYNCQLEPGNGNVMSIDGASTLLVYSSSVKGSPAVTDRLATVVKGSQFSSYYSYFGDIEDGLVAQNSSILLSATVMDTVGTQGPGLWLLEGAAFSAPGAGTAKTTEARNGTKPFLYFEGGLLNPLLTVNIRFSGYSAAPVRIGSNPSLSFSSYSGTSVGFVDGGGNTDVGIEFSGAGSSAKIPATTTVTGSLGDVRMADSSILSYTDIETLGPYLDDQHNFVSKDV